ncbi:hypothetical protein F4694_002560 [Bacillus niacini]|uniref:Uncharacterized protein n=1 Tax=Neobacillus niacini TaxID=86668 RepID=A0A852TCV0_9BACI|nr:hypothetical protein [Neobacillus niacini]NYE05785.1 hypothetical protein [Neobacillus niacini]
MLKAKNIIPTISFVLVIFIIYVSDIPTYIQLVLTIFSISFLLPIARKVMFEDRLRKIKTALYTTLIFSFGLTAASVIAALPSFDVSIIIGFLSTVFFSSIGIFCYGIPVSIIAELISNRYLEKRAFISAVIHIGFGLFTAVFSLFDDVYGLVFIIPTICSIIFFLMDEFTKRKTGGKRLT